MNGEKDVLWLFKRFEFGWLLVCWFCFEIWIEELCVVVSLREFLWWSECEMFWVCYVFVGVCGLSCGVWV